MAMAVEDIMCDQCIITSEINIITLEHNDDNYLMVPTTKVWLQKILYSLRDKLVPLLAAFLAKSLTKSLVPLQRIPLSLPFREIRVRHRRKSKAQLAIEEGSIISDIKVSVQQPMTQHVDKNPHKCVNCIVLHEPEQEPLADIIFVHGLHGGLDRTWAQGQWRHKNPKLKNLTPIRRHSTDDLFVPINGDQQAQQGSLKRTLTRIYTTIPLKMARKHRKNKTNNEDDIEGRFAGDEAEEIQNIVHEEFTRCWPQDWLPQDCPGVRVIGINYTTDMLWRPLWKRMKIRTDLIQRSKEMEAELLKLGIGKRPIVWVGHSKGGLYIKQIILNAWTADKKNEHLKSVFNQTKAIMFYSVPHKGSPIADLVFPFFKRSIEVLEVQTNCEFVLNLHRRFLEMYNKDTNKPEIFSFIDTENTPVGFTSLKFISYESADPDIGIKCDVPLDHRDICKPAGRDCFLYLELVKLINRSILNEDADPNTI